MKQLDYGFTITRAAMCDACRITGNIALAIELERMEPTNWKLVYELVGQLIRGGMTVAPNEHTHSLVRMAKEISDILRVVRMPCYATMQYLFTYLRGENYEVDPRFGRDEGYYDDSDEGRYARYRDEFHTEIAFIDLAMRKVQGRAEPGIEALLGESERMYDRFSDARYGTPSQAGEVERLLEEVCYGNALFPVLADLL